MKEKMKEKIKIYILFIVSVIFMVVSMVMYKKLSNREYNNVETEYTYNESKKIKIEDFDIYTDEENKVSIESFVGKPIVINIWTSWCTYCEKEMPYFDEYHKKEKDNIVFLMINATGDRDSIESANKYISNRNYSFDIYYDIDLEAVISLGIYSYPTTIFVDKEGYIQNIKVGVITKEELGKEIERLK